MNAMSQIRQLGFTLVELMIGVVVLAILLSLAIPNFQQWILNSQVRNAAESIKNGLQRARAEAVARNTNVEFALLGDDATCYDAVTLISSTCSSWEVRLPGSGVIDSRSSSEGSPAVKRTVTPPGATTATFNSFGLLAYNSGVTTAAAAAASTLTGILVDSTKLPADVSRELNVVISSPGGNVRMCDPNLPAQHLSGC